MSYAAPSDLMLRFDRNDIGQLVSDDKRPVSEVDLPTNQPCLTALMDASGMIDGAMFAGNLYFAADLVNLTPNSTSLLQRITCDIAMALLIDRRPGWNPEKSKAIRELANDHLERLRKGENTFNIVNDLSPNNAGEPVADGPTTMSYDQNHLNLWRDRATPYYGRRLMPFNR